MCRRLEELYNGAFEQIHLLQSKFQGLQSDIQCLDQKVDAVTMCVESTGISVVDVWSFCKELESNFEQNCKGKPCLDGSLACEYIQTSDDEHETPSQSTSDNFGETPLDEVRKLEAAIAKIRKEHESTRKIAMSSMQLVRSLRCELNGTQSSVLRISSDVFRLMKLPKGAVCNFQRVDDVPLVNLESDVLRLMKLQTGAACNFQRTDDVLPVSLIDSV